MKRNRFCRTFAAGAFRRGIWALLVVLSGAGPALADAALEDGCDKVAGAVLQFLTKDGRKKEINVGDFQAPPRLKASGGAGLARQLTAALKKHRVEVNESAELQLMGEFSLVDAKASADDVFDSVTLRIRAKILDKNDDELQALNINVFGNAAAQVGGATVSLRPDDSEAVRQRTLRNRLDNPTAFVDKYEVRADEDSPFAVEVLVRTKGVLKKRKPQLVGGMAYASLKRGEEYVVRLYNRSPHECAVEVTIDGLSMYSFNETGKFGSRVIVKPNAKMDVVGWYINPGKAAAFVITSYPDSAAAKKKLTTGVGTITCTWHACWAPDQMPPEDEVGTRSADDATGIGRIINKKINSVKRVVGKPRAVVSVRYRRQAPNK